jgi:lysophospholipase L1-like esterase
MRNYIVDIRPDVVVFMVGINDATWPNANEYDRSMGTLARAPISLTSFTSAVRTLGERTKTVAALLNIFRALRMKWVYHNRRYPDRDWANQKESAPYPSGGEETIAQRRQEEIPRYKRRLKELIDISRMGDITPIFMTQPIPFGPVTDPNTGMDLRRVAHGAYRYELLELYNDALREVARDNDVVLIDLAREVPKDTRLFFDAMHYTLSGEELVARIIYNGLHEDLEREFQPSKSHECVAESTGDAVYSFFDFESRP